MEEVKKGAFISSLVRNNKQIKADRAATISRTARVIFKRKVEDLELEIQQMESDRENMLDLSPTNSMSLIVASDFKADDFATKDLKLSMEIRNAKIRLAVWKNRFEYLFGDSKMPDLIEENAEETTEEQTT